MKKKLFICFLLIGNLMGNVMAQDIITNPLLFVFKLHGQTRKYQFTFNQSNDTLICIGELKETPDGNQAATPCPKKL